MHRAPPRAGRSRRRCSVMILPGMTPITDVRTGASPRRGNRSAVTGAALTLSSPIGATGSRVANSASSTIRPAEITAATAQVSRSSRRTMSARRPGAIMPRSRKPERPRRRSARRRGRPRAAGSRGRSACGSCSRDGPPRRCRADCGRRCRARGRARSRRSSSGASACRSFETEPSRISTVMPLRIFSSASVGARCVSWSVRMPAAR